MAGAGFPSTADAQTLGGVTPTAAGLALIDDASADAQLTTLGFPLSLVAPGATQRKIRPTVAGPVNFLMVANVAYFVYLGYTLRAFVPKYVATHLITVSTTDSVGEVGFFTTPLPPNKAGQTLTPIAGAFKTAWDDLTTPAGPRRVGNAVALAVSVPAGVHLWAGARTNTGGNEPTFSGIHLEALGGDVLTMAAAAAFDGTTTYAGLVPAIAAMGTAVAPLLWAEMD